MTTRPVACGYCAKPLPIPSKVGRPRRYCDDACRNAARRERNVLEVTPQAAEPVPYGPPPDPVEHREALIRDLLLLTEANAPGAPEDRLATTLLEIKAGVGSLRMLAPDLPRKLAGPAGELARRIETAMQASFGGAL